MFKLLKKKHLVAITLYKIDHNNRHLTLINILKKAQLSRQFPSLEDSISRPTHRIPENQDNHSVEQTIAISTIFRDSKRKQLLVLILEQLTIAMVISNKTSSVFMQKIRMRRRSL